MNFYKGKLMRIEYGKVDRLKVCITHIYYERKDKVKLLIEMSVNANESYYEYLLFRNSLYHIDSIDNYVYQKPNDDKHNYLVFNLTRTPFGTSGKEWEEIARKHADDYRKLRKNFDIVKQQKENILDSLEKILEGDYNED